MSLLSQIPEVALSHRPSLEQCPESVVTSPAELMMQGDMMIFTAHPSMCDVRSGLTPQGLRGRVPWREETSAAASKISEQALGLCVEVFCSQRNKGV